MAAPPTDAGKASLPHKLKINLGSTANDVPRSSLPTTYLWTREYAGGKVVASEPIYLDQQAPPSVLERALHTVSSKIRRSSGEPTESKKMRQWQEDKRAVYDGTCSFQVQYMGSMEVYQSKGVKVCEDAIAALIQKENRASAKKDIRLTEHHMALMHIDSKAITVIEEETQNVITEDTIQSISYCAAHRRNVKCFAYITRVSPNQYTWTCHAFTGITATGERMSHAVGCAFEACHEKLATTASNPDLTSANEPRASNTAETSLSTQTTVAEVNEPSAVASRRRVGDDADSKGRYQPVTLQK